MFKGRLEWLLPASIALLTSGLGLAANLATDLKSNWIAWVAWAILTLAVVAGAVLVERRRRHERPTHSLVTASTSARGHASKSLGLQIRRVRTLNVDGSTTVVEEIFSEELARQTLRDGGDRKEL